MIVFEAETAANDNDYLFVLNRNAYTTGKTCVTLDCSMQYLSPGTGTRIHCTAVPKKLGRTVLVYDVSLTDDSGRPVASGTYTFFAVEPHAAGDVPPEGR